MGNEREELKRERRHGEERGKESHRVGIDRLKGKEVHCLKTALKFK